MLIGRLRYQTEKPFVSMHRVLRSLPDKEADALELISFHSASKGVLGECGLRGGYMHMVNCHPTFKRDLWVERAPPTSLTAEPLHAGG